MERGTILVVDDELNIADLIELYLTRGLYSAFPIGFGYSLNGASTVTAVP